MNKRLHLLVIFLLISSVITFSQQLVQTSLGHNNQSFTLSKLELLEVRLPATPSTGYTWMVKENSKLSTLVELSQRFESNSPDNAIGASGFTTIKYMPSGQGTTDLKLVYKRPFETDGESCSE